MNSVKGQAARGRRGDGQMVGKGTFDEETMHEGMEDWGDETPESQQLRRALIAAGRAAMPRHDPARMERVLRRIMARLAEEEREGVPGRRIESPSGVTAKMFG